MGETPTGRLPRLLHIRRPNSPRTWCGRVASRVYHEAFSDLAEARRQTTCDVCGRALDRALTDEAARLLAARGV